MRRSLPPTLHIKADFIEFDTYENAFESLNAADVNLIAVNNTYVFSNEKQRSELRRTPIVFNPFSAYFAAPKNANMDNVLNTIDEYIDEMKSDPKSVYHQFVNQWFFSEKKSFWTLNKILLAGGTILAVITSFMAAWRYISIIRLNNKLLETITRLKETENILKKQQYVLQKAQKMGHVGSWELDNVRHKLVWTDENYKIFGIAPGTNLSFKDYISYVHPEDRAYVESKWEEALSGESFDIEHRLLAQDMVKWVREKAELEFNEKGECISAIGFTQDITDRNC